MEAPDSNALRRFFDGTRFRSGGCRGRWKLHSLNFPYAVVEIRCPDGRWLALRFECTGYPNALPTAMPWHIPTDSALAHRLWPRGATRISAVFRPDWKNGTALYIPCDRVSIDGHGQWAQDHPEMMWDPVRGLLVYLEAVQATLNSSDFQMETE